MGSRRVYRKGSRVARKICRVARQDRQRPWKWRIWTSDGEIHAGKLLSLGEIAATVPVHRQAGWTETSPLTLWGSVRAVFQIRERQMSQDKQIFGFEQSGDVLILTALGSFMEFRDNDIRNGYNEAYRLLNEPGVRHLLVDFSAMQYFGSTFVGILIRLAKKARSNNGGAALCHMSDNMKDMLKTLMLLENPKIDFSWVAYPDRDSALKALSCQ